jgi:hypothetical protein
MVIIKRFFACVAGVLTRLTVLVILTLVVTVFVLLLLIIVLALLFWHRRKQNKKSPIYLEVSKPTLSLSNQSQISGGKGEFQQIKESPKIT